MTNRKASTLPRGRHTRLWIASLYGLFLVSCGAILEISVRLLQLTEPYTPQPEIAIKLYYENPNGLVLMRPGARYFTNGKVPVLINEIGFRDRPYPKQRGAGKRIVVLGDSFTMGDGVRVEDSYPRQLEALLNRSGEAFEVLNCGITATNTLQQLALLREKVLSLNPDLVLLGFNLNDFELYQETSFERAQRKFDVSYEIRRDQTVKIRYPKKTLLDSLKSRIYAHSAGWRALSQLQVRRSGTDQLPPSMASFLVDARCDSCRTIEQAVLDMAETLRSNDIEFAVAVLPAMTELDRQSVLDFDGYPFADRHADIIQAFSQAGIRTLDTLPSFAGSEIQDVVVSRFNPHFNRQGNRILAAAMADFLTDNSQPPS